MLTHDLLLQGGHQRVLTVHCQQAIGSQLSQLLLEVIVQGHSLHAAHESEAQRACVRASGWVLKCSAWLRSKDCMQGCKVTWALKCLQLGKKGGSKVEATLAYNKLLCGSRSQTSIHEAC